MNKKRLQSTITNLIYTIGGIWMISIGVFVVGINNIILSLGSGYHHYMRGPNTNLYDYFGMYLVGTSLIFWMSELSIPSTALASVLISGILLKILRDSRIALGIIIAVALIILGVNSGLLSMMIVMTILGIAWTFNYIGESVHVEYSDGIHGTGWHIASNMSICTAVYLTINPLII